MRLTTPELPIVSSCADRDNGIMSEVERPILLVEDNEDDQILIKAAFESAGIPSTIIAVFTAEEAITYLSKEDDASEAQAAQIPAAVLIDLTLPGKSGHDLLKWIQGRKELQNLVRVVLSGSENPEDVDKSYRLGAHGYLMKPLTADQLNQPGHTLKLVLMQMSSAAQPA